MAFVADLHIHSRFSRATSKALTLPHLAGWSALKGIDVLGCGDFTHPAWRAEIAENLKFDDRSGLYRLDLPMEIPALMQGTPGPAKAPLFCLQAEISCIYKRAGRVRKVHNLVFMPDLAAVEAFCRRLGAVGNLSSDGRPILGLDSRDLLEMVLESSDRAVLVPAHVWTPWFSLFGSRSGFDSLEDCFLDLSEHIFALETGLSSDPAMNRCVSALDRFSLISNSDAHSGANLGREANLFSGEPSYSAMFAALGARNQPGGGDCSFMGTLEFYPEEGKYHLDGHRACGVSLDPRDARALGGICPHCGRPLTIGVLHRVMELADRQEPLFPDGAPDSRYLIPLAGVLSEILGAGENSQKVQKRLGRVIAELGSELDVLCRMPPGQIDSYWEPLGEAVRRMREGRVSLDPGFDGQYGVCRLFGPGELDNISGLGNLPGLVRANSGRESGAGRRIEIMDDSPRGVCDGPGPTAPPACSEAQEQALRAGPGPALVLAGPGAGKTRVLASRLARFMEHGEKPERLLALTFTRRAAGEMAGRLRGAGMPVCDTLHGLAFRLMAEESGQAPLVLPEDAARRLFMAAAQEENACSPADAGRLWNEYNFCRETLKKTPGAMDAVLARYDALKGGGRARMLDYGDLIAWLLENASRLAGRFSQVLVDEVQDLSPVQLEIVRRLLPADGSGFFGIGDPDQSIYGFRGAGGRCDFSAIWPGLQTLRLNRSYRAGQGVLDMASALMGRPGCLVAARDVPTELAIFAARGQAQELDWLAGNCARLLGSTSHSLMDQAAAPVTGQLSPGEIGVLVRLKALIPAIGAALDRAGLPWVAASGELFWEDPVIAALLDAARSGSAASPDRLLAALAAEVFGLSGRDLELQVGLYKKGAPWRALGRMWRECAGWDELLEKIAWLDESELISARADKIRVMTMHASKGLEFGAVFLPGLEDGILPFRPDAIMGGAAAVATPDLAEERRLLYVAITRAARAVYMSHCGKRRLFGRSLELLPSPLLAGIEKMCRREFAPRRRPAAQLSLFQGR